MSKSIQSRLEAERIIQPNGCWEVNRNPKQRYPQLKVNGAQLSIHRLAYEAYIGPIPDDLFVLHKCDNSRCHNPDHLFVGTGLDNVRDMIAKGRKVCHGKPRLANYEEIATYATANPHLSQKEIARHFGYKAQGKISQVLKAYGVQRSKKDLDFFKTEAQPGAKLTADQVLAIRADPRSRRDLATAYGVSVSAIDLIVTRKTWKHI